MGIREEVNEIGVKVSAAELKLADAKLTKQATQLAQMRRLLAEQKETIHTLERFFAFVQHVLANARDDRAGMQVLRRVMSNWPYGGRSDEL